jgi:hypothetical protein
MGRVIDLVSSPEREELIRALLPIAKRVFQDLHPHRQPEVAFEFDQPAVDLRRSGRVGLIPE